MALLQASNFQGIQQDRFERRSNVCLSGDLGYGDVDVPTLAQVVFLSDREGEDASSVATSLLQNAEAQAPQMPRFDWTTLKVHGSQTLSQADLGRLVAAAAKGQVGVGRVSPLRLR